MMTAPTSPAVSREPCNYSYSKGYLGSGVRTNDVNGRADSPWNGLVGVPKTGYGRLLIHPCWNRLEGVIILKRSKISTSAPNRGKLSVFAVVA